MRHALDEAPTFTSTEQPEADGAGGWGRISAAGRPGVVLRAYGKWYDVQLLDEPRVLLATVKGSLKRERRRTDLVAVGDRVSVIDVGEGEGQIEWVAPRRGVLSRPARNTTDVEQVIMANADQVLFVFALRFPEPHLRMLDRFLVLAEDRQLPARIVVNKIDLAADDLSPDGIPLGLEGARHLAEDLFRDYLGIYPVHFISVKEGYGLAELREALEGKVSVVAGPSGVGKSSLLNALDPAGERLVGAVSEANRKGRHTTVGTQLYRIGPGTFVADTPGMRALAMHGVAPENLPNCFPEFRPYMDECYFEDCAHIDEPDCAVIAAVERGEISRARYESYVALRQGDDSD